jgi:hypothetical protein
MRAQPTTSLSRGEKSAATDIDANDRVSLTAPSWRPVSSVIPLGRTTGSRQKRRSKCSSTISMDPQPPKRCGWAGTESGANSISPSGTWPHCPVRWNGTGVQGVGRLNPPLRGVVAHRNRERRRRNVQPNQARSQGDSRLSDRERDRGARSGSHPGRSRTAVQPGDVTAPVVNTGRLHAVFSARRHLTAEGVATIRPRRSRPVRRQAQRRTQPDRRHLAGQHANDENRVAPRRRPRATVRRPNTEPDPQQLTPTR